MTLDDDLRAVAAQQYGLVSRAPGGRARCWPFGVRSRVLGPDWEAPTPRVLRLVGAPAGIRQQLRLTVLDAGPRPVVSHTSAAALWRLATLHVSRARTRSTCAVALGAVHHIIAGLPCHRTARHPSDRGGSHRVRRGRRDPSRPCRAARRHRGTRSPSALPTFHALLDELGASGRSGVAAMRAVLATRPVGHVVAESGLEARFERILAAAGEGPLERQVRGRTRMDRSRRLPRPGMRIVVEVDSHLHHSSPLDRRADQHTGRGAAASRLGGGRPDHRRRGLAAAGRRRTTRARRPPAGPDAFGVGIVRRDARFRYRNLRSAAQEPLPGRTR